MGVFNSYLGPRRPLSFQVVVFQSMPQGLRLPNGVFNSYLGRRRPLNLYVGFAVDAPGGELGGGGGVSIDI